MYYIPTKHFYKLNVNKSQLLQANCCCYSVYVLLLDVQTCVVCRTQYVLSYLPCKHLLKTNYVYRLRNVVMLLFMRFTLPVLFYVVSFYPKMLCIFLNVSLVIFHYLIWFCLLICKLIVIIKKGNVK